MRGGSPQERWNRKHRDVLRRISNRFVRTLKGRHAALRVSLRQNRVPKHDLLWDINFYVQLIEDGKCHYCDGPLNPTSHALDCKNSKIGHRCFNVVPCCRSCNWIKMKSMSYEEMMLLSPVLKQIQAERTKGGH